MFFFKSALYVIGVPIGNIFDFSSRAIFVLKKVDFILTEDSRKICFLLSFFSIKNKVISISSYNENYISDFLIRKIKSGFSVAILSDAGTPGISDPGYVFVKCVYDNGFKVIPIPGASVVSTIVSISPFYFNGFIFDGFLPKKEVYKKIYFSKIIFEQRACIFFEVADRLLNTLFLMKNILSCDRMIFVAKDLTKQFEFVLSFRLSDLNYDYFFPAFKHKGEFTLLLSGVCNNLFNKSDFNNDLIFSIFNNDCFFKSVFFSSVVCYNFIFF
jgi:16S rRNA (cytidine1402-2'-O)-methyltransferase